MLRPLSAATANAFIETGFLPEGARRQDGVGEGRTASAPPESVDTGELSVLPVKRPRKVDKESSLKDRTALVHKFTELVKEFGEDCLIFRQAMFDDPDGSATALVASVESVLHGKATATMVKRLGSLRDYDG